jgi:hypothetical protein
MEPTLLTTSRLHATQTRRHSQLSRQRRLVRPHRAGKGTACPGARQGPAFYLRLPRSLNVLVSLQLLEKTGGTFRNTTTAARLFSDGSPDNARPARLHTANLRDRWSTLTDAVRAGTSVAARATNGVVSFIAAMDCNAKERAGSFVKAVAPNGVRRMLDLGGSGAYSIAFAQAKEEDADIFEAGIEGHSFSKE